MLVFPHGDRFCSLRWGQERKCRNGVTAIHIRATKHFLSCFLVRSLDLPITGPPLGAPLQPPHPQTPSTAGQQLSAVQMTCSLPLQWDASTRLSMNSAAKFNFFLHAFCSVSYQEEPCDRVALWESWHNCNINTVTALSPKNPKKRVKWK